MGSFLGCWSSWCRHCAPRRPFFVFSTIFSDINAMVARLARAVDVGVRPRAARGAHPGDLLFENKKIKNKNAGKVGRLLGAGGGWAVARRIPQATPPPTPPKQQARPLQVVHGTHTAKLVAGSLRLAVNARFAHRTCIRNDDDSILHHCRNAPRA